MHLKTRNVNTAFRELIKVFQTGRHPKWPWGDGLPHFDVVKEPSRNGSVLRINEPITVTYTHPKERVLFNTARDANPFFHLYEALWMLAGHNDVAPLAYYAKNMANYSDDGKTLNGAYGYRWRKANYGTSYNAHSDRDEVEYTDQLDILVAHLKADPTSRRAVLQMWNVEDDLLKIGRLCEKCLGTGRQLYDETRRDGSKTGFKFDYENDAPTCQACKGKTLVDTSKDVCCNLSVMFSLRENLATLTTFDPGSEIITAPPYLDMTVTNRSNDMIWGMLGANYVHFTMLQEYMAARLGVEVGVYHHFTNNLHVYENNWKPDEWLGAEKDSAFYTTTTPLKQIPLVSNPKVFEEELPKFVEQYNGTNVPTFNKGDWDEPFLANVAAPMLRAFRQHKLKCPESAMGFANQIEADDWRLACTNWLTKRINKKEEIK